MSSNLELTTFCTKSIVSVNINSIRPNPILLDPKLPILVVPKRAYFSEQQKLNRDLIRDLAHDCPNKNHNKIRTNYNLPNPIVLTSLG